MEGGLATLLDTSTSASDGYARNAGLCRHVVQWSGKVKGRLSRQSGEWFRGWWRALAGHVQGRVLSNRCTLYVLDCMHAVSPYK